tara:strand:+ start:5435 stop:5818 length:384 start_codon:yes stop_codon:yes gene_type:complete
MQPKAQPSPDFLKLQKRMKEVRVGEWVSISKKIQNKYSNLEIDQITRMRSDDDFSEYRAISGDYLLNIKTFVNYVSMSIGESEYEVDSYIDVVGALNVENKVISIWEIIFWLNWDIKHYDDKYLDFE